MLLSKHRGKLGDPGSPREAFEREGAAGEVLARTGRAIEQKDVHTWGVHRMGSWLGWS